MHTASGALAAAACLLSSYLCSVLHAVEDAEREFRFRDGERIVFAGDAFFEKAQDHGFIETLLTQLHPHARLVFRNLGWSGDTVSGRARAGFDPPSKGFERLVEHVRSADPTLLFLGYGMSDSFAGADGLPAFRKDLERLLDAVLAGGVRAVFVSPIRHEDLGPPLPDPRGHNEDLSAYADVLRASATARGGRFADLFAKLAPGGRRTEAAPITQNGIHLTAYGYWRAAQATASELGLALPSWSVSIRTARPGFEAEGTRLERLTVAPDRVTFRALDATLPLLPPPLAAAGDSLAPVAHRPDRVLSVRGLSSGRYALRVDGRDITAGTASEWARGIAIAKGPEFEQVARLREAIVLKNFLHFQRYRPQNNTYLFLFRKHEQGHLAREVEDFERLIRDEEEEIDALKVPVPHDYELVREGDEEDR